MKIVMISTDYLPDIGGVAAHIYNLSAAIIKLGHKVHIINARRYDSSLGNRLENDADGITVHRIYVGSFIRRLGYYYFKYSLAVSNYIKNRLGDFDILHQHDYLTSNLACLMLASRYPWVWTNHTSGFVEDVSKNRLKNIIIKYGYRKTRAVITPSLEINMLSRKLWYKKNIFYIPNGVDIDKFCPIDKQIIYQRKKALGIENISTVILCPRRWVPKNGLLYLIKAIAMLRKGKLLDEGIKFVFIGSDERETHYGRYLLSIIEEENLGDNILLLGKIPYAEMPIYNSIADIVVIPSLIEAISLSALEAMASAKPVIATNVGGLPEIIKDNETGIMIEPKNPEMLADAINKLLGDYHLREYIGIKARKLVEEKYSWDNIAVQTIRFYGKIINRNLS